VTNSQDVGDVTESLLSSYQDHGNSTAEDVKPQINNSLSLDEALDKFVPNKKTNGMVCSVKKILDSIEEPTKSKLVALIENREVLSLDLTTLLKNYNHYVSAEVMRRHRRRAKGGGCSCPI
jgi:hypothetical protein